MRSEQSSARRREPKGRRLFASHRIRGNVQPTRSAHSRSEMTYFTTCKCDGRGLGLSPSVPSPTGSDSTPESGGAVAAVSDATGSCAMANAKP